MDWGGIIAGAIGGGAQAVGEIADNNIRQREAEAAALRAEQRAIEGERRRSQLSRESAIAEAEAKLVFDEKRTAAKTERLSKENQTIEAEAPAMRIQRELADANVNAPAVDETTLGIIKSKLPAKTLEEVYGIKPETTLSQFDDRIAVARNKGFYETEGTLIKERAIAAADEKLRATNAATERRLAVQEKNADTMVRSLQQRSEPKPSKEGSLTDIQKATLSGLQSAVSKAESAVNSGKGSKSERTAAAQRLDEAQRKYDETLSSYTNQSTTKPTQSTVNVGKSTLPSGMTADQVISEAKAAISRGKDPAAVRARLKTMGLSL